MKKLLNILLSIVICTTCVSINALEKDAKLFATEIPQIFINEESELFYKDNETNALIPAEKYVINFNSVNVDDVFEKITYLGEYVVNDVYKAYCDYLKSPELNPSEITLLSTTGNTYQYNGYTMRKIWVVSNNNSTGIKTINKGTTTINRIKSIVNLLMIGSSNVYVNLISNGISVYQAFCDFFSISSNTAIATASDDYFAARLQYNKTTQYTEYYAGNAWEIGLVSVSVTVTNVLEETYLKNSGKGVFTKNYNTNKTVKSVYYDNPNAIAIKYNTDTALYEHVDWKCNNIIWRFN